MAAEPSHPSANLEKHHDDPNDLDPASFVQRIQELGRQRDQEDAERFRVLEAEISERRARREERARSLSPHKSPQPLTSTPPISSLDSKMASAPEPSPTRDAYARQDTLDRLTGTTSLTQDGEQRPSPQSSPTRRSAVALARSGTLSWSQKPTSRPASTYGSLSRPSSRPTSSAGRRPLSIAGSPRATPQPVAAEQEEPAKTRSEIAQSLGAKDPSYFKQTADRGIGSAAYRRGQEDTQSETSSTSGKFKLPGISPGASESEIAIATSPPPDSLRSSSPSRASSFRGSGATWTNRLSNTTATSGFSGLDGKSVLSPRDTQRFSTTEDALSALPDRPASPSKGSSGGFVQSAMMKRTDSINKRMSAQQVPTLSRQNSTASTRSGLGLSPTGMPKSDSRPATLSRDNSLEPSSRPSSSHSNQTITQDDKTSMKDEGFVRPALPHSRSKSVASLYVQNEDAQVPSEPPSPSKRFSPTKRSWVDSALNKPESPKPASPAPSNKPEWLLKLEAKQQRNSVAELSPSKSSPEKLTELKPVEMAIDAVEQKQPEVAKKTIDVAETKKPEAAEPKKPEFAETQSPVTSSFTSSKSLEPTKSSEPDSFAVKSPPLKSPSITSSSDAPSSRFAHLRSGSIKSPPPVSEIKPTTPGKVDFRAGLKSRQQSNDGDKKAEPEFMAAAGKLKRTNTQNYQAPDVLKSNILMGKAGLAVTGGPMKTERKDEFKESILKKREEMKTKLGDAPAVSKKPELPAQGSDTPEAIAKRKSMAEKPKVEAPLKPGINRNGSGLWRPPSKDMNPAAEDSKGLFRSNSGASSRSASRSASPAPTPVVDSKPQVTESKGLYRPNSGASGKYTVPDSATPAGSKGLYRPSSVASNSSAAESARPSSFGSRPQSTVSEVAEIKEASVARAVNVGKPVASSKLAERFNPQLANLLARGPPGSGSGTATPSAPNSGSSTPKPQTEVKSGPAEPLTHITKGRARGPKRKAPTLKSETPVRSASPVEQDSKAAKPEQSTKAVATSNIPSITSPLKSAGVAKHGRIPSVSLVKPTEILRSNAPAPEEAAQPQASSNTQSTPQATPQGLEAQQRKVTPMKGPKPKPLDLSKNLGNQKAENVGQQVKDDEAGKPRVSDVSLTRHSPKKDEASPPKPLSIRRSPTKDVVPKDVSVESPAEKKVLPGKLTQRFQQNISHPSSPIKEVAPKDVPAESPVESKVLPGKLAQRFKQNISQPPSPTKEESPRSPVKEVMPVSGSVKNAAAMFNLPSNDTAAKPSSARSPIKLPTKDDQQSAKENAEVSSAPEVPKKDAGVGLGIGFFGKAPKPSVATEQKKLPLSPPLSSGLPSSQPEKKPDVPPKQSSSYTSPRKLELSSTTVKLEASPQKQQPQGSPIPHTSEAAQLFGDFFDVAPSVNGAVPDIDTYSILTSSPLSMTKIKTLKNSIQEISGDGKLTQLQPGQEHVLYDQSMYVTTHAFEDAKGSKAAEVHLWHGSAVSESTVQDAQLFARKFAKDNNAKLVLLPQGKETPNFIQALGGILVTRRGSSSGGPSRFFILCGRRHLGHIVFDEVDMNLKSFCSGFPFLVAGNGKLYLWSGAGCTADELGCARLIAMDIGLTPEVIEVSEGAEPAAFLDLFPAPEKGPKKIFPGADFWKRKKDVGDRYRVRLFQVSAKPSNSGGGFFSQKTPTNSNNNASNMQIVEIAPVDGRADLSCDGVVVLDAFFEIYIILTPRSRPHSAAFTHALFFAQDYGITAASMEDRPFIPVSTVVVEGAPRDLKGAVRGWDDRVLQAQPQMDARSREGTPVRGVAFQGVEGKGDGAGGIKRGRSLRVVGLAAAIAAVNR
ncbi:hypothetical protein K402DRAFT_112514 [Aulographum hederae CBS 113979]|uniref:Uncharacterized protein n=1 Tax=Aulographum hederae CBS 113979 TaxID=1176131 RepID=A0A6G1GWV7_9PEZI|nr:hypothetical protein K402DRAFT_112514 [Aulographum hederae CBS 113979]